MSPDVPDRGSGPGDPSDSEDPGGDEGGVPEDWPVVESVTEYDTPWYTGGYDLVEQPDGSRKQYYWVQFPPAVVVLAVADGEVVFVEQYRPTVRERHLELPAGVVEDGESYTAAGARELREETGFDPAGVSLLEEFWVATGVMRHRRGIVFAEGLEPVGTDRGDSEFLSVRAVPVEDALAAARRQPAHDATIEAVLLAREEGRL